MDVTFQSGFRVTEKLRKSRGFPHAPAPTRAEPPPPLPISRGTCVAAAEPTRTPRAARCHGARWGAVWCVPRVGTSAQRPAAPPRAQSAAAAPGACVLHPDPLPATNARIRRPVTATTLFQSVTSPESRSAQPFQTGVCHSAVPVCSLRGFAPRGSPFLFSAE